MNKAKFTNHFFFLWPPVTLCQKCKQETNFEHFKQIGWETPVSAAGASVSRHDKEVQETQTIMDNEEGHICAPPDVSSVIYWLTADPGESTAIALLPCLPLPSLPSMTLYGLRRAVH